MARSVVSSSAAWNNCWEAPPWAAILRGLEGLTHRVDNSTVRLGEEIGCLRKETAGLNSKMTGLTKSMDNVDQTMVNHSTEPTKPEERMDKMEAGEGI